MRLNACLRLGSALAALGLVLGCQARHQTAMRGRQAGFSRDSAPTEADPDQVLAVAFVQNAIEAMSLGSQVAALNNLDQALGHAQPMQDQAWPFRGGRGSRAATLDGNAVNTDLMSARAKLLQGDFRGAAADLAPISQATPPATSPAQLLLTRASGDLELAKAAFLAGRPGETKTEIEGAAAALQAAAQAGLEAASSARTLARTMQARLSGPAGPGLGQFMAWTSQVDTWLGEPSDGAALVVELQSSD